MYLSHSIFIYLYIYMYSIYIHRRTNKLNILHNIPILKKHETNSRHFRCLSSDIEARRGTAPCWKPKKGDGQGIMRRMETWSRLIQDDLRDKCVDIFHIMLPANTGWILDGFVDGFCLTSWLRPVNVSFKVSGSGGTSSPWQSLESGWIW